MKALLSLLRNRGFVRIFLVILPLLCVLFLTIVVGFQTPPCNTPATHPCGGPPLDPIQQRWLGDVIDWISLFAGVFLWAAFLFMGIVARRFEKITAISTGWPLLMVAPSGILTYTLIQFHGYASWKFLSDLEKFLGFSIFLISALICVMVVKAFHSLAQTMFAGSTPETELASSEELVAH